MRIRLTLTPERYPAFLSTDQHHLASFIYETIAMANPELARWLHDEGLPTPGREDKRLKPLVFGVPECPRYTFQGADKVFHNGAVQWQIGSPMEDALASLGAGLAMTDRVQIGGTTFLVTEIMLLPPPVLTSEMRFIALSPLTASITKPDESGERRSKVYLRDESALAEAIAANLRWKHLVLTGEEAADAELEFTFDQTYLRRNGGLQSRSISRLMKYGKTNIKAYAAPFFVRGNPQLIGIGWECGFGEANAQGFGMAGIG